MRPASDPFDTSLNPPLPPLPLTFDALAGRFLAAGLGLGGLGVAIMPLFGPVVAFVGAAFCVGLSLCALVTWWVAAGQRQELDRFRRGNYGLAWHYDADTWRTVIGDGRHRSRRNVLISTGWGLLGGALGGLIVSDTHGTFDGNALLSAACFGATGTVMMAGLAVLIEGADTVFGKAVRPTPQLFVLGPRGFYLNGAYVPWNTYGQHLASVHPAGDRPERLRFSFRQISRSGFEERSIDVPVPAGREAEAAGIIEGLAAANIPIGPKTRA